MIPDLTVVWVIAFVLVLSVVLDRLLLRPITNVMRQREGAIGSARQLAEESRARAQAAAAELEQRTRAARGDVYRQMEEKRRAALDRRGAILAETVREIQQSTREATDRLHKQAAAARQQLERETDALAAAIVERVLGRKAS